MTEIPPPSQVFLADVIGKSLWLLVLAFVMGVGVVGGADVVHLEHVAAVGTAADGLVAGELL